jgi:hypothetical protein
MIPAFASAVRASDLDQEFSTESYSFGAGIFTEWSRAQTFTVGREGFLYRIDLPVSRTVSTSQPAQLELRSTLSSGEPDLTAAGLMAISSVPSSSFPTQTFITTFTAFDFGPSGKLVSQGQLLAMVLSSQTRQSSWYLWMTRKDGAPEPEYSRGSNWLIAPGGVSLVAGDSGGFRTHVRAIPEPSAFTIAATSLLAMSLMRRRRFRPLPAPR